MNDPSAYMRDGSYKKREEFGAKVNDKVYYTLEKYNPNTKRYEIDYHSAIYVDKNLYIMLKSKWGEAGVYYHAYDDCPYYETMKKIEYYYR